MCFTKLKKLIVAWLASFAMIFNTSASTSIDEHFITVANAMNAKKFDPKYLISLYEKFDPKKALEIKSYLETHSDIKKMKMPKVVVENHKLSFVFEGQKFLLTMDGNDEITMTVGIKEIKLDYSMGLFEIEKKIMDSLKPEKKYSVFNMILPEAHAQINIPTIFWGIMGALSVLHVWGVAAVVKQEEFQKKLDGFEVKCNAVKSGTDSETDLRDLPELYNQLTDLFNTICVPGQTVKVKGYNKMACEKTVPRLKLCFKEKVVGVNATSRGNYKEFQLDVSQDKFVKALAK